MSLHTTSRVEAERLEKEHDVAFAKRLQEARTTDKDGFSRDRATRLKQLSTKYFDQIDNDNPDPEAAMASLPARDQRSLELYIERLADEQLDRDYESDDIIRELAEILPWVKDIA